MESWRIRRAEAFDASALAACIDAAYATYAGRISDLPPVSANCADEIAKYQVWVAEIEGEIVAGLVMIPEASYMMLANLAVQPDRSGVGLGRALVALAERESSRQGFGEMRLSTHAAMPENVRFYTRLGWEHLTRKGNKVSMTKAI
jgi:GNAT superfamily N-acetyltransferase